MGLGGQRRFFFIKHFYSFFFTWEEEVSDDKDFYARLSAGLARLLFRVNEISMYPIWLGRVWGKLVVDQPGVEKQTEAYEFLFLVTWYLSSDLIGEQKFGSGIP